MSVAVAETDTMVELIFGDVPARYSHFLSPEDFARLVERVEALRVMKEFRRGRSVEAAKEAHSHGARASRL